MDELEFDWIMSLAKAWDDGYPSIPYEARPGPKVSLTRVECMTAGMTGLCRQIESAYAGRVPRYPGKPGDMWRNHLVGAFAEAAFAKWLGVWFGGTVNTFHAPDVNGAEVRWNGKGDGARVRKDDVNIRVVGLTGEPPELEFLGWIYSEDAKRDDWWQGWCRAYVVPVQNLKTMESWGYEERK